MSLLRLVVFTCFVVAMLGCPGSATKSDDPSSYLARGGKLAQLLEVRKTSNGGGEQYSSFVEIQIDGTWSSGGETSSAWQYMKFNEKTGELNKEGIAELAAILAKHDLLNLVRTALALPKKNHLDPYCYEVSFGEAWAQKCFSGQTRSAEEREVEKRFLAVFEGVKALISNKTYNK